MTAVRDLENAVSNALGLSRASARASIDAVLEAISGALAAGEKVQIAGFGAFKPITRAARKGRNPATGEAVDIPERRDVTFKASAEMKGKL